MKKRLLTLIFVLFGAVVFAQIVPQGINYQAIASGLSMNSSSTVKFGTVVCVNSDNNSLLIHLKIK